MRKLLICALALGGFAASAQAADLGIDSLKDPLPDTLSYKGVTIYGTIDVGYGYESNGTANGGALYTTQTYNLLGTSRAVGSNSNLTDNALSQSTIGIKVEEAVGLGFVALAKIETGFNPNYGEIADACQSLVRAGNLLYAGSGGAGVKGQNITAYGDGSRCGQAFNGEAYAGLSNSSYGTLKIGRQNSLDLDLTAQYDPMGLSYAMSLIGFSGSAGGGVGSTETARWDNSIKYLYQYGPVHAAVMYAEGAEDTSLHGNSVAANAGFAWKGLSVDAVYTNEQGAVNSVAGGLFSGGYNTVTAASLNSTNSLGYFLSDNEAWTVAGKYSMDVPSLFGLAGGMKDCGFKDECAGAKLTFFGGYQHSDMSNYTGALGGTTIGGYELAFQNNILNTTRTLETAWAGAKYETGPWAFTGAWYYLGQNSFNETNFYKVTPGSAGHTGGCSVNAAACSGDLEMGSFLVDYSFNKHFDVYAGVSWETVSGGLDHSFQSNGALDANSNTTVVTGMRLKF